MISLQDPAALLSGQKLYFFSGTSTGKAADVIVLHTGTALNNEEQTQLQRILAACKIATENVVVLPVSTGRVALVTLAATYNARKAIIFGDVHVGSNIQLPKGKVVQIGEWMLLKTDSLQKMLTAKPQEKQQLWEQLKMLFSISG
ncbi:MAG: hypothetical protein JNK66_10335 [Chitinophagales bacterium]|nr:hypothetical protein [Chitinophagales bacterium]